MNRSIAGFCSVILLYFLIMSLFCSPVQPAQSIALSNLCGQFGHSCFGGNWGKRNLDENEQVDMENIPPEFDHPRQILHDRARLILLLRRLQQLSESN